MSQATNVQRIQDNPRFMVVVDALSTLGRGFWRKYSVFSKTIAERLNVHERDVVQAYLYVLTFKKAGVNNEHFRREVWENLKHAEELPLRELETVYNCTEFDYVRIWIAQELAFMMLSDGHSEILGREFDMFNATQLLRKIAEDHIRSELPYNKLAREIDKAFPPSET